ncbi:hypothetical protein SDC9_127833 [bioreactor metagenome]|uniref:Uncharacterized protein n=1 Tax=bioreactor metagenome TaxID=1076179 RepID=A0A645CV66_9ZZZZ
MNGLRYKSAKPLRYCSFCVVIVVGRHQPNGNIGVDFSDRVQDIISGDLEHLHIREYNVEQRYVIYKAFHIPGVGAYFYLKPILQEKLFYQVSQGHIVFENEYFTVRFIIVFIFVRRFFYGMQGQFQSNTGAFIFLRLNFYFAFQRMDKPLCDVHPEAAPFRF